MKKKILSIMLAAMMVSMYTVGSTVTAFADGDTTGGTGEGTPAVEQPAGGSTAEEKLVIEATDASCTTIKAQNYNYHSGEITFMIPENASGNVVLDYHDGLIQFFRKYFLEKYGREYDGAAMPGDWYGIKVNVVNNSSLEYKYVDKSFNISGYSDDLDTDHNKYLFDNLISWTYSDSQNVSLGSKDDTKFNNSVNKVYAINNYSKDSDVYSAANTFFDNTLDLGAGSTIVLNTQMLIDGPNTDNVYAGCDIDIPSSFELAPVAAKTTYTVKANYYTTTNNGTPVKDNQEDVIRVDSAEASIGEEITVVPNVEWSSYNNNQYALDPNQVLKLTTQENAENNILTLNYYRDVTVYYPPVNPTPTPTPDPVTPVVTPDDPDNNNTDNPDTPVVVPDQPDNNNTNTPTTPVVVPDQPENNNVDQPKTGDENSVMPWAIMGLTSAVLAGAVLIQRRKEDNN